MGQYARVKRWDLSHFCRTLSSIRGAEPTLPRPLQQFSMAFPPLAFDPKAGGRHDEAGVVAVGKCQNLGIIETGGTRNFCRRPQKVGKRPLVGINSGKSSFKAGELMPAPFTQLLKQHEQHRANPEGEQLTDIARLAR